MSKNLYLSISKKYEGDLSDFIGELYKYQITDKYIVNIVSDPIYYFRESIIDEVVNNGFESLLKYSFVMDDITTPSMHVDEIDSIFNRFVEKLKPAKELIIIDPYFYPKEKEVEKIADKFIKLISPIFSSLHLLTLVTNGNNKSVACKYEAHLLAKKPDLKIKNLIIHEFHDRFWINPDNKTGLIVGTSINGIGNKISLVDSLSCADVEIILNELKRVDNKSLTSTSNGTKTVG
jgi:hypothetical protein